MKTVITMTTKGTFTMPAKMRKKLGVTQKGSKLYAEFDESTQQVIVSKPVSVESIHQKLRPYIKDKPALEDVSALYQKRQPRV